MAGIAYNNVELRKLPPRFRMRLAQILDIGDAWKILMATIPSEQRPDKPKYTTELIDLVERHGITNRKSFGEILLDEWSTSGRNRPKVEDLYELLQKCELYRAADFVATEILDIPAPDRPTEGPARIIPPEDLNFQPQLDNIHSTPTLAIDSNLKVIIDELNNYDYHTPGKLVNFRMDLLEKATNSFSDTLLIGSGAFGTVYALDLRPLGPKLAIKLLHPSSTVAEDQFMTEIQVLSKYRHENLVPLIGWSWLHAENSTRTNGPRYCLVYEFMSGGTLLEALQNQNPSQLLNWFRRISILIGIATGMKYLHMGSDQPLIHRDLKSANILLDENLEPKIGDFGLAKSISHQTSALTSTIFGTSAYMAPEAFRGDISVKMDVFSYGVMILEVLTGLPPYDENRDGNDIVTYLEELVEDDNISPFLDDKAGYIDPDQASTIYSISSKCLSEKKRRPTSEQVLRSIEPLLHYFNENMFSTDLLK